MKTGLGFILLGTLLALPAWPQGVVVEELKEETLQQDSVGAIKGQPADTVAVARKNLFVPETQEPKSRPMAVLYSALLPGLGENYLGSRTFLRSQLAIDGFVAVTFGVLKWMQYKTRKQVRVYLATAGHCPAADTVSNYSLLKIATLWKDSDTLRLESEEPSRLPLDEYVKLSWYFDSRGDWEEYKKLWTWEENFGVYASYSLGGLALNRLFSMVHTFQLGKRKKPTESASSFPWNGEFTVTDQFGTPVLQYQGNF